MDVHRVMFMRAGNLDSDLKLIEPKEKGSLRHLWLQLKAFEMLIV